MSDKSWRSQLIPKALLDAPEDVDLLDNLPRPSGLSKKPRLRGGQFLGPGTQVAQLGRVNEDGSHEFRNCPRFNRAEWDLSTALGELEASTIVRIVRAKPPAEEDVVRYIKVEELHPRNLASYKTPIEKFEEHCSIVVDTRFCDPRTDKAREHWEAPEAAECLKNATAKVVACK